MHISSPQPQPMWQHSNTFAGMANTQPHQQLNAHYTGGVATGGSQVMMMSQPPLLMQQQMQQQLPSMMTFSQYHIPTHHGSPSLPIGRSSVSSMSMDWNVTPRYSIDSSMHTQGAPIATAARKHSGAAPVLGAHPAPSPSGPAGSSSTSAKVGIVCRHFIEGKCNRRKCRFVHDAAGGTGDATVSHVDENMEGDDVLSANRTTAGDTVPALQEYHSAPQIGSISAH
jgi:hypothetical protein